MTVYEMIQSLCQCEPDAQVHFRLDVDAETIQELAEDNRGLFKEYLSCEEIYDGDSDVNINLTY